MPQVRVSEHSDLAPEIVLAAGRDFSDRRAHFLPFIPGSAAQSVRGHLRHFLASIAADETWR
jgi:hypothetical protein